MVKESYSDASSFPMGQGSTNCSVGLASNKFSFENEISTLLELFHRQITLDKTSKNEKTHKQNSSERSMESSSNNFDLDYIINKQVSSFAIPSFSVTSLTIVWVVNLLVCLLCFILAEIYQEYLDPFPLILLVILGCHLITMNNFFPYVLGRYRYGSHHYQLYQPFKGGHKFIILQFFGIFCVLFSLSVAFFHTLFLLSLSSHKNVHHGLYTIVIVFGIAGNILLYRSLHYFQPHKKRNVSTHSDTNDANPIFNETFPTPESFLEILYTGPNRESGLVVIFVIAQYFVSVLVVFLPDIATIVGVCCFLAQLLSGVLIHFTIGRAHRPGYGFGALRLRRGADTIGFWTARALYIGSLATNVALLMNSTIIHKIPFICVCVASLNGFSSIIFFFFVRTASFSATGVTPSESIFHLYGTVLNVATYLLGASYVMLTFYITLYEAELNNSKVGQNIKEILHFCLQLILAFSLFMAPITQACGCAIHNVDFAILCSFQVKPAFLSIQWGIWLLYLSEFLATALFLFTGTHFFGLIACISSAFTVTCITYSARIYNSEPDRSLWVDSTDLTTNLNDTTQGHCDTQSYSLDNASKQQKLESDLAFAKLRSLFLNSEEYSQYEGFRSLELSSLFNTGMIYAYICALTSFMLCFVIDLSERYMCFDAAIPRSKVLLLGCLFIGVSVPLANFSAQNKDIQVHNPLSANSRYVVLYVLSWTLHVFNILGNLFLINHFQKEGYSMALISHTIRGLLQFIPLILITIFIAMKHKNDLQNRQHRWISIRALQTLNLIFSKMLARVERKEDKDTLQILFSAVAEPVLQMFGGLDSPDMLHLCLPTQMRFGSKEDVQESQKAPFQPFFGCTKKTLQRS
ncbi:unnamed protein product [Phytomonas sp. Hart1]|nr:unnamed protein product [Phytomonas sp. Hart1]|eukprot:CCW71047.1 unnamed protein product [Phytomonas sp. isolate Hart1]